MSQSCGPLTCTDDMKTGVASIDDEHLILVNMLNMANEQLTDGGDMQLDEIIRDLLSYALYHFDNEEELMLKNHYPEVLREKHFQEHRKFSAAVARFQQDISQGKPVSGGALLDFLQAWLVNHILDTDKQLGEFLCQHDPLSSKP